MGDVPSANKNQLPNIGLYDWCRDIGERCAKIEEVVKILPSATFIDEHSSLRDFSEKFRSCESLEKRCRQFGPVLSPKGPVEAERKTEMGTLHDVPAFYELADTVITRYIKGPEDWEKGTLTILYPESGYHAAIVELGVQILRSKGGNVNIIMTEIDPEYLQTLAAELKNFSHRGLTVSEPTLQKDDSTHQEWVLNITSCTTLPPCRSMSLTFVLGKKQKDETYPPSIRQTDFDKAQIIVVFDASDTQRITDGLDEALKHYEGTAEKIFIVEDRDSYKKWVANKGLKTETNFSQHFGCEDPHDKNHGLGLGPILFKIGPSKKP